MGDQIWQQIKTDRNDHNNHDDHDHQKIVIESALLRVPFRIITITLLSFLLPLVFLLLARIACARFLLSQLVPSSLNSNVFLQMTKTYPAILYLIVFTISIAALVHSLTDKLTTLQSEYRRYTWSPLTLGSRPYAAWILLWTLQVSVGLGIKGTVALGTHDFSISFGTDRALFSREIFFLGLHETMIHWSRLVVEPVVNDTIFSVVSRNERWFQRGVIAGSFGGLWYWRLGNEVKSLVVIGLAKREMSLDVKMVDFAGWWLYYLTVMIGVVKVIKGLVWLAMSLFCRTRVNGISSDEPCLDIEEKV